MNKLALLLLFGLVALAAGDPKRVKIIDNMKLKHEAASAGGTRAWDNRKNLKLKRDPTPFAGSPEWQEFAATCISHMEGNYEYKICPFHNITQVDIVTTWNAYAGVLGVYSHCVFEDGKLVQIAYTDGDDCAMRRRLVNVTVVCGPAPRVVSVAEPKTCKYAVTIAAPIACRGLFVDQILNATHLARFTALREELFNEEITQKGFAREVSRIYDEAGLNFKEIASAAGQPAHAGHPSTAAPFSGHQGRWGSHANNNWNSHASNQDGGAVSHLSGLHAPSPHAPADCSNQTSHLHNAVETLRVALQAAVESLHRANASVDATILKALEGTATLTAKRAAQASSAANTANTSAGQGHADQADHQGPHGALNTTTTPRTTTTSSVFTTDDTRAAVMQVANGARTRGPGAIATSAEGTKETTTAKVKVATVATRVHAEDNTTTAPSISRDATTTTTTTTTTGTSTSERKPDSKA